MTSFSSLYMVAHKKNGTAYFPQNVDVITPLSVIKVEYFSRSNIETFCCAQSSFRAFCLELWKGKCSIFCLLSCS